MYSSFMVFRIVKVLVNATSLNLSTFGHGYSGYKELNMQ